MFVNVVLAFVVVLFPVVVLELIVFLDSLSITLQRYIKKHSCPRYIIIPIKIHNCTEMCISLSTLVLVTLSGIESACLVPF